MTGGIDELVKGHCETRFERVRVEFTRGFRELAGDRERGERGAALAVWQNGQLVVDLWAGHRDRGGLHDWQRDTLTNVYSSTKGLVALVTLRLAAAGVLELDAPVSELWPGFGKDGGEKITTRQLLGHTAGLPAIRAPLSHESLYDWEAMTSALAAEPPWWEPGTRHGYHAFTFGWLLGEVVRRVSGRSVGVNVAELAESLGVTGQAQIGLDRQDHGRVAELGALPPALRGSDQATLTGALLAEPQSASARAFLNPPLMLDASVANSVAWREAEIPAANGHVTARALATLYGGTLDAEGIRLATAELAAGPDLVLRIPTRFSHGFMMSRPGAAFGPGLRAFGHPGAGGSLGFADPDQALGFGYVPNRMGAEVLVDPRPAALANALYQCLADSR